MVDWTNEADLEEWEYPDPDPYDDGEPDLIQCPECAREVFADAEQCSQCGHYFVAAERCHPTMRGFGWLGWLIVALLLIILLSGVL